MLTGGKACEDCGCQIPRERLAVLTQPKFCVFCQEKQEGWGKFKRHKMNIHVECSDDTVEAVNMTLSRGSVV